MPGHEGQIYLDSPSTDQADRRWQAVAIGPGYGSVVEWPPVRFRRANPVLALPEPEHGKPFDRLRWVVNVPRQAGKPERGG